MKSINCAICGRTLENSFSDEHHLIPKSRGGKYGSKILIHRICHDAIHSIWTEKDLADYFHTIDRIIHSDKMKKFIKWVSKKPPEFYSRTKSSNGKRKK